MSGLSFCPERMNMKKSIKVLSLILVLVTFVSSLMISTEALSWDGNSAGGGGGGTAAGANGYAIAFTDDMNIVAYRFSVVNKSGANKVSKVIDVFRKDSTTYISDEAYSYYNKYNKKYNKKQLINNQNGNYATSRNTTNCYKESSMKFATSLPDPDGLKKWQNNKTNLNKILSTLGVGDISKLNNGDKILVEPVHAVRLESVWHAVSVTETAIYGKHMLGANSNGGSSWNSESWGFIAGYVNKHFPNALFTPDGQGLWAGVSASSSQISFYNIINKGYGVGIAYTETKDDFSPVLAIEKCEAWPGNKSSRNNNRFGTSTGNKFANWTYDKGYPKSGDKIWYSVTFPKEKQNCYVKQTVSINGGGSTSRNVWSDSGVTYDFALNPTTVEAGKSYYTVKAKVDWIDSNGKVKKNGAEKTFYIPIKPIVTRERASAYNEEGKVQAYSGASGSSGKLYFGQKVTFQYLYGATSSWESSNNLTGTANRWNGSSWAHISTKRKNGEDVYQEKVTLSKTKSFSKNSSIGAYTIPLPANSNANSNKLQFYLTSAWSVDPAHTAESNTYTIPVVKSDVAITDMKLVDKNGNYVDKTKLEVGDKLTPHYFYKNNTDCTVFVKGYNDDKSQISGVYAIPAKGTIEVAGKAFTVPNKRSFDIWGGVYLSTVKIMNTDYETNGDNNAKTFTCNSLLPLTLTSIAPNADYREGTDVISSFRVWNKINVDYTPKEAIQVRLRIYKVGQSSPFKTLTKDVVVPAKGNNLVFFKWNVPTGLKSKDVVLKADLYDGKQYYHLISDNRATTPYTYYTTPDTRYEENAPSGFKIPSKPSAKSASAKWDVYEYENGKFVKKTYAVAIRNTLTNEIEPATGSTATKTNGTWTMKSGYGISIQSKTAMASVVGYPTPLYSTSYTLPQYAYALLPEYGYAYADKKAETLIETKASDGYNCFIFQKKGSYGNTHFTPLWYPDGNYTVKVVQSDCWTPAGMISLNLVTNTVKINGNAYDDWYAAGR